ncbi:MAG: Fur family zinc uptake transcriptional regulator [Gammaproteobacteria bacterium]|jgi:Fur family zinc uptake transcriptional regulator
MLYYNIMSIESKNCLAFRKHDHRRCQKQLLAEARKHCANQQLRLTPRRQQVLEILLRSHQPLGAYDILSELIRENPGEKIAPPMVYRALEFLQTENLIHRLESKNAYIGCQFPGHSMSARFLICQDCQKVAELESSNSDLHKEAARVGFEIEHPVVEISGTCSSCRNA